MVSCVNMDGCNEPYVHVFLFADDLITTSFKHEESLICANDRVKISEEDKHNSPAHDIMTGTVISLSDADESEPKGINHDDEYEYSAPNVISQSSSDVASSSSDSSSISSSSSESSSTTSLDATNPSSPASKELPLPNIFLFELQHSPRPTAVLFLYLMCHSSFYELFSNALYSIIGDFPRQRLTFLCLTFISLLTLRITGGLFDYLGWEQYKISASALKERARLAKTKGASTLNTSDKINIQIVKMDKSTKKYFKRHKYKKQFLNVMCYYMCSMSVAHFHAQILPPMADMTQEIVDGLPSGQHGSIGGVSLIGHRLSLNRNYPFSSEILPVASFGIATVNDTSQLNITAQELNNNGVHESNTCAQNPGTNQNIYQYDDGAYLSDQDYLFSKMSLLSYWSYMHDESHKFLRTRSVLLYHATFFTTCYFTLSKGLKFSFW